MASFTPITANQPISYAMARSAYRNAPRESISGTPVFFVPSSLPVGQYGYNGPRYKEGYTYYNCPAPENTYNGNCTWWCWGRLYETTGTYLPNYGDAYNWYDRYAADGGSVDTNANNIQPGDIIVMADGGPGHVCFVEQVVGNTVYISQSAYSQRSIWSGMSCLVTTYQKSDIYQNAYIDMYKDLDASYFQRVIGVIHTGGTPGPGPTPTENLDITITPSSYNMTMLSSESYKDFSFDIVITGIPAGQSVSGGNTYPGLSRISNGTGWVYTDYTVSGTTYRQAVKRGMVLRYTREYNYAYTVTRHMYFNLSFSTGTISTDTPMRINAQMTRNLAAILMAARRRKKGGIINVDQV